MADQANTTFKRGQKCVCIAAPNGQWRCKVTGEVVAVGPKYRSTYTITDVVHFEDGHVSLVLAGWSEACFSARWFRPVVERSMRQDIALFAHHLVGDGDRVLA